MDHVGIDLGGKESQVCARSPDGAIRWEGRWPTARIGEYLRECPPSRVVLETCAEAFAVADAVVAAGHEIRVVPCSLVRSLGVGALGVKTDASESRNSSVARSRENATGGLMRSRLPPHRRSRRRAGSARR